MVKDAKETKVGTVHYGFFSRRSRFTLFYVRKGRKHHPRLCTLFDGAVMLAIICCYTGAPH